jgi:ATP-dependent DNA helicase RecG
MYNKERGSLKTALKTALQSALQSALQTALESRLKSGLKILEHIQNNPQSTLVELAKQTGYSRSWVAETMKRLQEQGVINRIGYSLVIYL